MPGWPDRPRFSPSVSICNAENWYRETGVLTLWTGAAWSTANLAVYTPIYVPKPMSLTQLGVFHGGVVSGNIDVGIFLPDSEGKPGARLVSKGSTAQAGINSLVLHNTADVWVDGLVYLACALDNNTGQLMRLVALAADGSGPNEGSIFTQAAAFPLPANATPNAAGVAANIPVMIATVGMS